MKNFTELDVWRESRKLVKMIYLFSKNFPKNEVYGITQQMRRAAVSVSSNIAEGCGRNTPKDTNEFMYISRGSLFELETQAYLAFDLDYLSQESLNEILTQITTCKKLLNGFINYFKAKQ